jgi:predicted nucleotidyltransferase
VADLLPGGVLCRAAGARDLLAVRAIQPLSSSLPPVVEVAVARYLGVLDRWLPDRIHGFYVVGSTALGAFRPGRSDVDFVAVLDRRLDDAELRRLRLAHLLTWGPATLRSLVPAGERVPICDGVFVASADMTRPVTAITPVASHVGSRFSIGEGFDVNPVMWQVLADHGIAVRGSGRSELGLETEPDRLRQWNLDNLDGYWRTWGEKALRGRAGLGLHSASWLVAWGALGAPRLHYTIATGRVVSKEAAGAYAIETFGPQWRPMLHEALAYWRREVPGRALRDGRCRIRRAGEFVLEVVDRAHAL